MTSHKTKSNNRIYTLLTRTLLILIAIGIYFSVGRPIRKVITEHIVAPVVQLDDTMLYSARQNATGVSVFDPQDRDFGFTLYTVFGSFFLFGVLGFIAVGASRSFYLFLTTWHMVLGIATLLFTRLALHHAQGWIHAAIFTQNLLLHWMTVLLVPLALYWVKHHHPRANEEGASKIPSAADSELFRRPE